MASQEPVLDFSIPKKTTSQIVRDNFLPRIPPEDSRVRGGYKIRGIGTFVFHVFSFGRPHAKLMILSEDENHCLVEFVFGSNPETDTSKGPGSNRDPKIVFLIKSFLNAWHARLGHISGYEDKPVPYPLPPELKMDVSCKSS